MNWIRLHPGRERSVLRRHPWLLSGAVAGVEGTPDAGELVEVRSASGETLGWGDWSPHSPIRVRFIVFGKEPVDDTGVEDRIAQAIARRRGDPTLEGTDAARWVNAEGDGLPGLVVDHYAGALVVRVSTAGMARRRKQIGAFLKTSSGASCALWRPDTVAARRERIDARPGLLWGDAPQAPVQIREGARRYAVDVAGGQKTGFYLDGRDARALVARVAQGARVLDLFGYTGGYSVAAAAGGAASVTLVDSSAPALALADTNFEAYRKSREGKSRKGESRERKLRETGSPLPIRLERADAFDWVRNDTESYDLLVVDPPPLARRSADVRRAARGYKDILLHALRRAAPGAQLFVFSCSHHIGPDLFRKIVFGASLDAGRSLSVLAELGAPPDHPVALDHPEGRYFTGLWLRA